MLAIASNHTKKRIYHVGGCIYEKRIKENHRIEMKLRQAKKRGYCACKYCGGIGGYMRVYRKMLESKEKKKKMHFTYVAMEDTCYIRTDIGFWRLSRKQDKQYRKQEDQYVLYHLNHYDNRMTFDELSRAKFHRQCDVKPTESIGKILAYVEAHDRAKKIIADDYRKLPHATKQQKKYYKNARRKEERRQRRRLDELFDMIENGACQEPPRNTP